MGNNDLKILLSIEDRVIGEDIQNLLEESGIYTMLVSDNSASSVLTAYTGLNAAECVSIQINKDDYDQAMAILIDSPYAELVDEAALDQPENE